MATMGQRKGGRDRDQAVSLHGISSVTNFLQVDLII